MTTITHILETPRQAHQVISELFQQNIKPLAKKGAKSRITWETVNLYKRHQLRKMFHGPVLRDIADQVWVPDGHGQRVRYNPVAWKLFFAQMFIEPRFEEYTVRATGEVKVRQRRRSTEDLNDDQFAEFLLQVQAFAAVDLGVEFTEQEDH